MSLLKRVAASYKKELDEADGLDDFLIVLVLIPMLTLLFAAIVSLMVTGLGLLLWGLF